MKKILEMTEKKVNINELNPANLAYVGDACFEVYVRTKITLEENRKIKDLNREALKYVKASEQARSMKDIMEYLTDEEIDIYKRGRNNKCSISSKSATVSDYRMATGFETLIGYLLLSNSHDRLDEIMKLVFDNKFKEN